MIAIIVVHGQTCNLWLKCCTYPGVDLGNHTFKYVMQVIYCKVLKLSKILLEQLYLCCALSAVRRCIVFLRMTGVGYVENVFVANLLWYCSTLSLPSEDDLSNYTSVYNQNRVR